MDGNWRAQDYESMAVGIHESLRLGWNAKDVLLRDMGMAVYVLGKIGRLFGIFQSLRLQ